MGLFGRNAGRQQETQSPDEQAIARYQYMLETAPPETIEQAHAEAFAKLTADQRRQVLQKLAEGAPASERPLAEQSAANPQALARLATRAEMRQPGTMGRMFGQGGGMSMGGLMAGTLLASIAGTVLGSAIAQQFFSSEGADAGGSDSGSDSGGSDGSAESGEADGGGGDLDAGGFDDF